MKLKYLAKHIDERHVDEYTELLSVSKIKGVVPRSEVSDNQGRADDISHYKTCKPNDLVINRMAAYQGALGVAKQFGAISPDYMVLRFQEPMDPRYVGHLFKSAYMANEMSSRVKGIGSIESGSVRTPRLSWSDLGEVAVNVPTVEEQKAIADFLDVSLLKIDQLVEAQKSLKLAAGERRKALLEGLTLGGIDPNVTLKQTGVKWLPEIPEHWEMVPASFVFGNRTEKCLSSDVHLTPSQTYGVVPQSEYMKITGNRVVLNIAGKEDMRHVEPGDFISHLRSFQGGLEYSSYKGKVSAAYTVLKPVREISHGYFKYLLKSPRYIQALSTTTEQLRDGQSIRYPQIKMLKLPFPPVEEQETISRVLSEKLPVYERIIEKSLELEKILLEHRQALISEAIMGKLDIGGSANG